MRVGVLHPGEMGSALGACVGGPVLWASDGRSEATARRAAEFEDADSARELAARVDVVLSVCPPHAARDVAATVAGFDGLYVDANAIAPATAREIAEGFPRFVDGGIVGPPPHAPGTTRLYLSGPEAPAAAELFAGSPVDARVVSDRIGEASALKMVYAGWTKGTSALLLAVREAARAEGVEDALLEEWRISLPQLAERWEAARRSAQAKGWRWVGEMEEIAATFAADGLPPGFHEAAAEIYRREG
jgi:3-hydroxyisobutyrate dehydrogenase-like beta-hydroxyacid dehydrogenase